MRGLGHWIDRWADFQPHKTAIAFQGREISYSRLAQRIRQFARLFAGELGVSRGDRVGFLGTNHPDFLATLFACARIGAIMVPLNWRLTVTEHPGQELREDVCIYDLWKPWETAQTRRLRRASELFP